MYSPPTNYIRFSEHNQLNFSVYTKQWQECSSNDWAQHPMSNSDNSHFRKSEDIEAFSGNHPKSLNQFRIAVATFAKVPSKPLKSI